MRSIVRQAKRAIDVPDDVRERASTRYDDKTHSTGGFMNNREDSLEVLRMRNQAAAEFHDHIYIGFRLLAFGAWRHPIGLRHTPNPESRISSPEHSNRVPSNPESRIPNTEKRP
jgi:hypothetical protein